MLFIGTIQNTNLRFNIFRWYLPTKYIQEADVLKILCILALLLAHVSLALGANYISPDDLKQMIQQQKDMVIVDIQPTNEYEQHHFKGSIETTAFPVKNSDERQLLDKSLPAIKASSVPVVIVCPRGGSGAKNSYEYFQAKGIPEDRLLILKGGIAGWPFQELLQHGR
jgi:rhodanese-related sulfurtransferase